MNLRSGSKRTNLKDDDVIWFGKYQGMHLGEIPDEYFEYLLKSGYAFRGIKQYAKERLNKV